MLRTLRAAQSSGARENPGRWESLSFRFVATPRLVRRFHTCAKEPEFASARIPGADPVEATELRRPNSRIPSTGTSWPSLFGCDVRGGSGLALLRFAFN